MLEVVAGIALLVVIFLMGRTDRALWADIEEMQTWRRSALIIADGRGVRIETLEADASEMKARIEVLEQKLAAEIERSKQVDQAP